MAASTINNPNTYVGDLNNLTTSNKSNVVEAVNELNNKISNVVNLGQIDNLNISPRLDGKEYYFTYFGGVTGAPSATTAGHGILYVNAGNANYGDQIAFSDAGTFIRKLSGGNFTEWIRIEDLASVKNTVNSLSSNLGSPSSASAVTGADAFSKINTLNSNLANKINTSAIANNLTTTSSGYVLDARQGKTLNNSISSLNTTINNHTQR